jgi:outer membrane protein
MRIILLGFLALALSAELRAQEPPPPRSWNVTVGAGAFVYPRYPGSDEYRVIPLPLIQVNYRERVYLGPSTTGVGYGLGAYAVRTPRLGLAVELGGQDSRPESRGDALAGLEGRDAVATAGVSVSYRAGAFEGIVALSQGVNDGAGLIQTTRITYSRPLGKVFLVAAAGAALANGKQMRREFGITDEEAARRQALIDGGDERLEPNDGHAYNPDGGLRHLGVGVSLIYPVSSLWSLMGFAGVERLSNEAAASPLVRRREQFAGGLGLGFRL